MNPTEDSFQHVYLLSTELMVSSLIEGYARRHARKYKTCSNLDIFRESLIVTEKGFAILDLFHLPAPLDEIMQLISSHENLTTLAFAPHVRTELLRQAEEAGCDLVIPRSQLDRHLENRFQQESSR